MSKITYADKVALNTNTEIPAQNKVEDTDMNNIKGAVNEIGKYNTATAGTNGDFNVTLKGTLSSGDIVNISFPTAIVPTANARLSIDGGTTYKNIKYENGVQALASDIQSVDYELKYNGTDFITINSIPKVLYNNATGSNVSFSVNETFANFQYVEIFYKNNDGSFQSLRVFEPNGKKFNIFSFTLHTTNRGYIKAADVGMVGTSVTLLTTGFGVNAEQTITAPNVVSNVSANNPMSITRILGYRK